MEFRLSDADSVAFPLGLENTQELVDLRRVIFAWNSSMYAYLEVLYAAISRSDKQAEESTTAYGTYSMYIFMWQMRNASSATASKWPMTKSVKKGCWDKVVPQDMTQ